ncbi:MAG TPA: hypothetical protein QGF51_09340 [Candidatus Marinimicrobia bacterium]|nr:hypothetical protein [Candidatus Neomarinimicrobiota bacterium]
MQINKPKVVVYPRQRGTGRYRQYSGKCISESAGVYLYTIQAGEFRQTKKMILLK